MEQIDTWFNSLDITNSLIIAGITALIIMLLASLKGGLFKRKMTKQVEQLTQQAKDAEEAAIEKVSTKLQEIEKILNK